MELIGYEEEDMGYREGAGDEDYDNEDENFIVRDDEVE